MQTIKYGKVLFLVAFFVQIAYSATYTVSKDGTANFTSIQTAVDTAGPDDEIIITDVGVYEEQVTIDSTKNGLILRSKNPMSLDKPTIKFQDTENVHPKTNEESKEDATINFDRNGALQILGAKRVRIEGIAVDGDDPYVFGYDAIWDGGGQMWPLQHGNGGITLWIAGDCAIRYCDISNSFFGINIKDRNIGGVFANPNPADIDSLDILPFSGFAQTGNHVFEYNRIHDNSFGMYFESSWDLGSTIRYNLFYHNHHSSSSFAAEVKGLTSEGNNQPGGAIMTKDNLLSPLAIYNNTFWKNNIIFVGIWKAGGQHLIFNNIYSQPDEYFSDLASHSSNLDMMKSYANRMFNCVIAAQHQAPGADYISVTNDFSQPKAEGDVLTKPCPAGNNIRYLETEFISTDPTNAKFLEPLWTNDLVQKYIIDQGWEESGVKDPDESRADLGAIPSGGGRFVGLTTVRPTSPVVVDGSTATIRLAVVPRIDEIASPKFTLTGLVTDLDSGDVFGNEYKAISSSDIHSLSVSGVDLKEGANKFDITIPATSLGDFAFFEFIVEGYDSDGILFTSSVGFIPYRKIPYYLEVTVQDIGKTKTLTEVKAGVPVNLHIEAFKAGGSPVTTAITPLALFLGSTYDLYNEAGIKIDTLQDKMPKGVGDITVVFHKVPVGGKEQVQAAGRAGEQPFLGSSDDIIIRPGDPDHVTWQDPASRMTKVVATGSPTPALAQVFDLYDNLITTPPITVNCVSAEPDIGIIVSNEELSDQTGFVTFLGLVKNGNKGDTFPIVASLPTTGKSDTAFLIVGDARDEFRIFYGDTAEGAYDTTIELRGCSGERFPIVIRSVKSSTGATSIDKQNSFDIFLSSGLKVYADEVTTISVTKGALVNGETRMWIQGTGRNVKNGNIKIVQQGGNIDEGERSKLFFDYCSNGVEAATYYADNGVGAVNRLELYYRNDLVQAEVPDTFKLYWPLKINENMVIVTKDQVVLDVDNPKHITIDINPPFAAGITKVTSSSQLGTSLWYNPKTPEAPVNKDEFNIGDGVGPLISSAILIERLSDGDDTIMVSFTETVPADVVKGVTLFLIKAGTPTPVKMTVKDALPASGNTVKIIVDIAPRPKEGDSLKIISTGTIVDGAGNHAHVDNLPAPIVLKPVPADISDAIYLDGNADGQIDVVRITFKKNIDPLQTAIQLKWNGEKQLEGDFTGAALTMVGTDVVEIALFDTTFGYDNNLRLITYGDMDVKATFLDPEFIDDDNVRTSRVRDGAAPVIKEIEYHKGRYLDNGGVDNDTLYIMYTEELAGGLPSPSNKQPIIFEREGVPTAITYNSPVGITNDLFHRFIVVKEQAVEPISGDSAWINTAEEPEKNAMDLYNNVQDNPDNRRVPFKTVKPKFQLDIKAGPKPCDPELKKIKIVIKPKTDEAEWTVFKVKINIYDKVGNIVKRFPEDKPSLDNGTGVIEVTNKLVLEWDGTNSNGRIVGSGTYVCFVNGTYTTGEGEEEQTYPIEREDGTIYLAIQKKSK